MDSQTLWLLATIICLSSCLPEAQAQTCGDIGTVAQEFNESREQNFFLNTQDPAPCDGNVTQFQYCYYRANQFSFAHLFTFAIYRETSEGSNTYTPVSDAFNTGTTALNHGRGFRCITYNPGLTIPIQAGDMIGACVYDPPNEGGIFGSRVQLDVVGQDAGVDRFLMKAVDNTGCGNTAVPDSVSGLTRADSLVLHINASIVPNPTTAPPPLVTSVTTATSTPAVSDVVSTPVVATSTAVSSSTGAFPSTAVSLSATTNRALASTAALEESASITSSVIVRSTTSTIATSELVIPILTSTALSATPVIVSTTTIDPLTMSLIPTDPPGTASSPLPTAVVMTPSLTIASTTSSTPALATATTTTELSTNFVASTPTPSTSSQTEVSTSTFTLSSSGSTDVLSAIQPSATPIHRPITGTNAGTMETTAPTTEASTGGMSVTIIAVVVVIVVLVVAIAVAIIIFCLRKKGKKKQVLQLGFTNATYTGHGDSVRERVRINDVYSDIGTDLEHTYASGTYSLATDPYDFPKAVTNEKPLSDSAYAECGPYDEVRATFTPCKNSIKFSELLDEAERRDIYDELSPYQVPASEENDIYGQLKLWGTRSISRQEIQIVGHLGSGQYGSVDRGLWNAKDNEPVDVALKSLTKTSEEDRVKFLQEAAIMAQFRHSNVILLHGIVIESPTLIVAEIAANGDLRSFLHTLIDKTEKPSLAKLLLKCSNQVALGMEYLSTKGFVHRDLAARNVLVTQDYTCKIADFGMSRDLADENYYVSQGKDKIPVKWTAPEAIHYKKYSTASDVWAYGCLLYEIWSLGHKPFEGVTNQETIQLIDRGRRLSPPPGCPRRIYELMINCWHPQTMVRPTFQILALTYSGNEGTLLGIPKKDSSTHPLAGVLGAPLEAGENMYQQLQNRYRNYDNKAVAETDDDYSTPTTL